MMLSLQNQRHDIVKIKCVEQLVLWLVVAAHHRKELRQSTRNDHLILALHAGVFQQHRPVPTQEAAVEPE
jgi:hypothetical protein